MEANTIIANILSMGLSILGGLWWPVSIMPNVMQDIAHWTPTYRFADVAWRIPEGKAPDVTDLLILVGYVVVFSLLTTLVLRRKQEQAM